MVSAEIGWVGTTSLPLKEISRFCCHHTCADNEWGQGSRILAPTQFKYMAKNRHTSTFQPLNLLSLSVVIQIKTSLDSFFSIFGIFVSLKLSKVRLIVNSVPTFFSPPNSLKPYRKSKNFPLERQALKFTFKFVSTDSSPPNYANRETEAEME